MAGWWRSVLTRTHSPRFQPFTYLVS
jgi:hypothetical protein